MLRGKFRSATVADRLAEIQQQRTEGLGAGSVEDVRGFSLARTMVRLLRREIVVGYILGAIAGLISCVVRPLALRFFLQQIELPGDLPPGEAVGLLLMVTMVTLCDGLFANLSRHLLTEDVASSFVAGVFSLLLEKILKVSPAASGNDGDGPDEADEVSMFGNDLTRSYNQIFFCSGLPMSVTGIRKCAWALATAHGDTSCARSSVDRLRAPRLYRCRLVSPLIVGGAATAIWIIGIKAAAAGLGVTATVMYISAVSSKKGAGVEHKSMALADARMSILTEVIESIKAVKYFGWEPDYFEKLQGIRKKECRAIRRARMLHVTSNAIGRGAPVIAAMASILTFHYLGGLLTSSDAFAIVTVFQSMRLPIMFAAMSISALENIMVSIRRLQSFMNRGEWVEPPVGQAGAASDDDGNACRPIVRIEVATFIRRGGSSPALTVAAAVVPRGKLTALVGTVGSGKTTLIESVLGELDVVEGVVEVAVRRRGVGYVPQHPVVISGTIVENIIFGRPFDRSEVDRVLEASDFGHDLRQLPGGEDTEIGERGTTLSGGQKQRLAIARALYGRPHFLILDDPLSAVDAAVCNRIFERAVRAHVAGGGTVLMAMNQTHLLPQADHLIVLDAGRVTKQGTFDEISRDGFAFAGLAPAQSDVDQLLEHPSTTPNLNKARGSSEGQNSGATEKTSNSDSRDAEDENYRQSEFVALTQVEKESVGRVGIGVCAEPLHQCLFLRGLTQFLPLPGTVSCPTLP